MGNADTLSVELWLESYAAASGWMRRIQQHTNQHTKTLSPDDRRRLLRVMLPSRTGGGTGGGIPRRCFSRVCPAARYFIFKKMAAMKSLLVVLHVYEERDGEDRKYRKPRQMLIPVVDRIHKHEHANKQKTDEHFIFVFHRSILAIKESWS